MLDLILSGTVTGLFISAPLGPMAALAALEVSRNRWPAALAVTSGVVLGDIILAVVALILMKVPLGISVPHWLPVTVGSAMLLLLAAVIWKEAEKPVQPAESQSFIRAIIATLTHPGNTLGYLGLYAATLTYFANRNAASLNLWEDASLVLATVLGMVLGWALFLRLVWLGVQRYGQIHPNLQARLSRGVSILMLVSAAVLVSTSFR